VLEAVGQALLDDPIGGQFHSCVGRRIRFVEVQFDRQAGFLDAVHQSGYLGQAGRHVRLGQRWRPIGVVTRPQRLHHAPQVGQ
jgi:hypothetical protein